MKKFGKKGQEWSTTAFWVILVIVFITAIIFGSKLAEPWFASQTGKAELAQAEQNRQIAVLEATAKKESAIQLAQAEIERARGVAEANKIIGDSLKGNEDYLRYLWITDVAGANVDKSVIYIPTETNIPILEATRIQ
jgi:regulator of protease activity HflC (stomatin/prohibitin superfamily)